MKHFEGYDELNDNFFDNYYDFYEEYMDGLESHTNYLVTLMLFKIQWKKNV